MYPGVHIGPCHNMPLYNLAWAALTAGIIRSEVYSGLLHWFTTTASVLEDFFSRMEHNVLEDRQSDLEQRIIREQFDFEQRLTRRQSELVQRLYGKMTELTRAVHKVRHVRAGRGSRRCDSL